MGALANSKYPAEMPRYLAFHQCLYFLLRSKQSSGTEIHHNLDVKICDPLKQLMDYPILIACICMGKTIRIQRVKVHMNSQRIY